MILLLVKNNIKCNFIDLGVNGNRFGKDNTLNNLGKNLNYFLNKLDIMVLHIRSLS